MSKPQRFYFITAESLDNDGCIVVASKLRKARMLYWHSNFMGIDSFLDMRCHRVKPNKPLPKELPLGILKSNWIGLIYGLYSYIEENCPFCHKVETMAWDSETETQIICPACQKEIKEGDVIDWKAI